MQALLSEMMKLKNVIVDRKKQMANLLIYSTEGKREA